ncbi:putative phage tail assembly chaperone [Yersinia enterocolitica]|uniref:putative phage tail assembly chaperone n=1 Tax=Yersinia enterocolitica TaxID=630 RepID=UPI001C6097AC|nr:putative phage tail assembly chaperone [Yersinia enterocolitica]MBW5879174.1 putative phage tail assembly chaperone [Yersinia enterocolitica]HEN3632133.1 putative phage tail assembly chaperone [Yersinia enterocolitica]
MTDKNTQTDTLITLQIGEHELSFAPTTKDYNDLQNDFMPDNKIAPLKNYLRRIVIKEHRELLNELLEKAGMPASIATAVNNEFVPDVEITVKK